MTLVSEHFRNLEKLIRALDKGKIAIWFLNEGYYPEQYVLPPSFSVSGFKLKNKPYNKDFISPARRGLVTISYPKSLLTSRIFGIQHPYNYHDIVYYLLEDWDNILNHLFQKNLSIFSYSLPIPVNARDSGELSTLRSGRMIYEWIEMAEKDIIAEAYKFNYIIRTDITNFYSSIYTHSIGWAINGRENAFADKEYKLTGNKIDRLIQYANDGKTNGIPIGSALSDLIAEIVLTSIDVEISKKLKDIKFVGCRFKDDYRILCNSDQDAKTILKVLANELINFNLLINEQKTQILTLPHGIYRQHEREYHPFSLKGKKEVPFKTFELTLLKALDIHKLYPGTSILEKFLAELYDDEMDFKVEFSNKPNTRRKQILKLMSLLILLKRESEKTICHVLAIYEVIYNDYWSKTLKSHLKNLIESEIIKASQKKSVFEIVWLVFFSRYLKLGIKDFSSIIGDENMQNPFLKSITTSTQRYFNESKIILFEKPKDCMTKTLAKRLAVFGRAKE